MDLSLQFLLDVLARNRLEAPDRRMLFAYRLTADDYLRLRTLVAGELAPDYEGRSRLRGRAAQAAFVLYAAEWWKRDYAGGAWRWRDVLASLAVPGLELRFDARSDAMESGLWFWGHQPSSDGKRYFGAIVAQGGLPMRVIERGGGAIAGLLTRALRLAHQFGWADTDLEAFFAQNSDSLVQHLRQAEIHQLFAGIVVTVLALRRKHGLAGAEHPIETLNAHEPNWRERFALAVDDGAAEQLLLGLVKEAASADRREGKSPVVAERYLVPLEGGAHQLRSEVQFPRFMATSVLESVCGLTPGSLPRYFSVDVEAGGQRRILCEGRQLLNSESSSASLSGKPIRNEGSAAAGEQLLRVRDAKGNLGEVVVLPGGAALEADLPWVLVKSVDRWVIVATGPCRVPDEEILVVVPSGGELLATDESTLVEQFGTLVCGQQKLALIRLSGTAELRMGETVYRLRTRQKVEAPDQFVLKGRRVGYPSKPLPVYLGVPVIYRYRGDEEARRVGPSDLDWSVLGHPGERIADVRGHRGPVEVWVHQDGERLARFRFVLESADAR